MVLTSFATACFSFFGTFARTFRATWTWQRWTLALGNSSSKTYSNPDKPSMIPKTTLCPSNPRTFKSLKNSLQEEADSLSPACKPTTSLWPLSDTPLFNGLCQLSICMADLCMGNTPPDQSMGDHGKTPGTDSR